MIITYRYEDVLYVMEDMISIGTEEEIKQVIEELKQEDDVVEAEAERVKSFYYN